MLLRTERWTRPGAGLGLRLGLGWVGPELGQAGPGWAGLGWAGLVQGSAQLGTGVGYGDGLGVRNGQQLFFGVADSLSGRCRALGLKTVMRYF